MSEEIKASASFGFRDVAPEEKPALVREALEVAGHKLPFKTRVVARGELA